MVKQIAKLPAYKVMMRFYLNQGKRVRIDTWSLSSKFYIHTPGHAHICTYTQTHTHTYVHTLHIKNTSFRAVVAHAFNPSTLQAEAGGALWASLIYRRSFRTAKDTQKNPVWKKKKQTKNNNKHINSKHTLIRWKTYNVSIYHFLTLLCCQSDMYSAKTGLQA